MTRRDRPYVMTAVPAAARAARASRVAWTGGLQTLIVACLVAWCFTAGVILIGLALMWHAGHLQLVLR